MYGLPGSFVRFVMLVIAAAVVTSFYCGPGAILGVLVAFVFLAQFYSRLNP
jgi:hypothetical protein